MIHLVERKPQPPGASTQGRYQITFNVHLYNLVISKLATQLTSNYRFYASKTGLNSTLARMMSG